MTQRQISSTERGVIFDIKKFAVHDGPGIRTTVFFKGCPLRCWWCHNPESQTLAPEPLPDNNIRSCSYRTGEGERELFGKEVTVPEVLAEIEKDRVFYDESGGGTTFSGGEPLMQPRFLQGLLSGCRDRDIHTAVDTSGYAPWRSFQAIIDTTDLFLYDLKLMDNAAHRQYTSVSNRRIHHNLRRLHDAGAAIFLRIPLIPGYTDTESNLVWLARFIADLPRLRQINLLPYNPIGEGKYRRFQKTARLERLARQSEADLQALQQRFKSWKIDVKIGG